MAHLVYADGLVSGRDGQCGGSFAVYDIGGRNVDDALHAGLRNERPKHVEMRFAVVRGVAGIDAEIGAIIVAVSWCSANGLVRRGSVLHVCSDSEVAVRVLQGRCRLRKGHARDMLAMYGSAVAGLSARRRADVERMFVFHHVSGDVMKASVLGH